MTLNQTNKREYGIDLFRIICCIFVINFHICDLMVANSRRYEFSNYVIYFIGSICVAGFFLMNGYFSGKKKEANIKRDIKKICSYLFQAFIITVIFCIVYHIFGLQTENPIKEYINGFMQKGIIPSIWYLISYAILMLAAPIFLNIKQNHKKIFYGILIGIILFNIVFSKTIYDYTYASSSIFWLHYYLAFFLIGMTFSNITFQKKQKKWLFGLGILSVLIYLYINIMEGKFVLPQASYGSWYFYLYLISVFCFFKTIEIKNKTAINMIEKLSEETFLIYLIAYPFSVLIDHFIPFKMEQNSILISGIIFLVLFVFLTLTNRIRKKIKIT